jgi:hypothetical protein
LPDKKKQHLIPKCYLQSFADPIPPEGVPPSKYKPAIWSVDKSLMEAPTRKGPNNALWKPYFYNLEEDNPSQPYVEDFLSIVENNFSIVLRKIENHEKLNSQDMFNLSLFIDTLFRRTETQVEFWQEQIDKIEKLYRKVDFAYNDNENASNEYFTGSHELAKKLVADAAGAITELVLQVGFSIVVNDSDMPFFTSDHPVTYTFKHIDDLYRHNIPKLWTYENIGTNEKKFFCYCPLTPRYSFISSPFIKSQGEDLYRVINDPGFVDGMNFITQLQANSVLIASTSRPYVHYQELAIKRLEMMRNISRPEGQQLRIYTNRARYDIMVSKYERINDHPIYPKIKFWTNNTNAVQLMANDQHVDLVEFYENGEERGGTRNLKFISVSIHPDMPSILEADW